MGFVGLFAPWSTVRSNHEAMVGFISVCRWKVVFCSFFFWRGGGEGKRVGGLLFLLWQGFRC